MKLNFAILVRTLLLLAISASTLPLTAQSASNDDMDRSIKPGADFYRYANGSWLRTVTISAGQPSFDNRAIMAAETSERVRNLVQEAGATHSTHDSITQKVGDYHASFMDV